MNLYNRIGPMLCRRSKVPELISFNKTLFVAHFRTRSGGKVPYGIQGISSGHDSSSSHTGPFQALGGDKRTTKTVNTCLNWNELKEELSKMPSEKKEIYMEAMIRGILSKNTNVVENKVDKKRFSSSFKIIMFSFVSLILISYFFKIKVIFGDKNLSSIEFPGFQKTGTDKINVTFDDVKGMDEARAELMEIVEYLREPEKYVRLGGKLPKGVMLIGPPGTGKTLLARAVAGEANVPFFYRSGSEFDEILVGRGAKRVRDLFKTARNNAPCIIFIDEIDSIGSERVSNSLHPFANQTINQLLTEMDGFDNNEGIIVIGATNRPDHLDKALLRPGRFDVRVNCRKPDLPGRKEIIQHYLDKVLHKNIDIDMLAKTTIGFSAADIKNIINQAALKAATEGSHYVMQKHLEEANDRAIMGPARIKGKLSDERSNKITAYHEAGHTLVSLYTPHTTPLHKVTIIPRGDSLGITSRVSDKDEYHMTKAGILAEIDVMMGGRAAEELIFGNDFITTGASNDLKKATSLTKAFIRTFGMSENIGLRNYDSNKSSDTDNLSPQISEKIDIEIDKIMNESYARAKSILTNKASEHNRLAKALLEYETLTAEEVKLVIEGKPLKRKPTEKPVEIETKKKIQSKNLHPKPMVVEGSGNFV